MEHYEKFFKRMESYTIETRFYENGESFEVEELYQAFKDRMIHETYQHCLKELMRLLKPEAHK